MNARHEQLRRAEHGSVFVVVLLISFGLISLALYFANAMSLEMRASDNRTSGLASEQVIEGASRYVSAILTDFATNGAMPDIAYYQPEAVPVGDAKVPEENARFWLIGRDTDGLSASTTEPSFGLVDESAKLNLNAPWVTADIIATNFPLMSVDFANAILDWRGTNSDGSMTYSQSDYTPKHAPFESTGELRLVYGATLDLITGEDVNRNGALDGNERDENGNGHADPGMLDFFTVFSHEPNTYSDGSSLTNVNDQAQLQALLEERLGSSRAQAIVLGLSGGGRGGGGGPGGGGGATTTTYASLLQFYIAAASRGGMTADEFGQICNDITVTNGPTIGRVNVNTASGTVLACLPGMDVTSAQTLVQYRQSNPASLTSIAWIVDALGSGSSALQTLASGDYITGHTHQFTADIAAVGPYGRGYRRVRFVFDTSEGTPKVIYRQDLSRLGWALGEQTRETWIARNTR